MNLSREDTVLMLSKYTAPDAPPVAVFLLLSSGSAFLRRNARLSTVTKDNTPFLRIAQKNEDDAFFPLDCFRARYAATPPLPVEAMEEDFNLRFEGALSLITASGDRLYIYERKQP